MEKMSAVEEKKTKNASESIAFRTSAESKANLLERLDKRGWKNNAVVDNVIALLDKTEEQAVNPEFASTRELFVKNQERSLQLFDGMIAMVTEHKAETDEEAKKKLESYVQMIRDMQSKATLDADSIEELKTLSAERLAKLEELAKENENLKAKLAECETEKQSAKEMRDMLRKMMEMMQENKKPAAPAEAAEDTAESIGEEVTPSDAQ